MNEAFDALQKAQRVHRIIAIANEDGDRLDAFTLLAASMCTLLHTQFDELDRARMVNLMAPMLLDEGGVVPPLPVPLENPDEPNPV